MTHVEIIQKRYLCFREKEDERFLALCKDDLDRGPFFQLLPKIRRLPGYRRNTIVSESVYLRTSNYFVQ